MTITHVISGLRAGGAEHLILELCKYSVDKAKMNVVSLGGASEMEHKFKESGITVTESGYTRRNRAYNAFKGVLLLLKTKPDIIHAHMFHACMVACMARLMLPRSRIVFTLHNNQIPELHRRLMLWATKFLRNNDIVFPGMNIKWFQKENASIVRHGIDVSRYVTDSRAKPPLFTCVFVGRIDPEKNPLQLVAIAKSLAPRGDFIIKVAGDGPLMPELSDAISRERLDRYFELMGYVNNVPDVLMSSHCLLLPSLWEGLPMVVLQAGACRVPVVATPVGAIPSLIGPESGFVGSLEEFPAMIGRIWSNYPDAWEKAARLQQVIFKEYTIESCFQQHMQVYYSALDT